MVKVALPLAIGMELGSISSIRSVGAEFAEVRAVLVPIEFVADCPALLPDKDMAFGDWQPVTMQATDNIIVISVEMIFIVN
jgi:hypothetical protein